MPTSAPLLLTAIATEIVKVNPRKILDVGIGVGKWGLLAREYGEIWNDRHYYPEQWESTVVGVEIHEKYRNPVWAAVYNKIYIGDALELLPEIKAEQGMFDLAIFIDALEHFEYERGLTMLRELKKICKKVIFSYSNSDQHDVCENKFEDHISKWEDSSFRQLGAVRVAGNDRAGWGVFVIG